MKKVLKVLGICVLVFLVLAVVLGISVFKLLRNSNASTIHASEEEVQEVVKQMGNDIMDGGLYLDGKVYQLPVTIADLTDGGWVFDESVKEQLGEFPANAVTNNINIDNANDNQKMISIVLINPYEEKKTLEDVLIAQLSVGTFTANKVVLPQGITWKSTMEDVEAAYGEASEKSEDSITYENETWKIAIYFKTGEDGRTTMSDVSYRLKY